MGYIEEGLKYLLRIGSDGALEFWIRDLVSAAAKRDIVVVDFEELLQNDRVNILVNDTRIILSIPSKRAKVLVKEIRDILTCKGFTVA